MPSSFAFSIADVTLITICLRFQTHPPAKGPQSLEWTPHRRRVVRPLIDVLRIKRMQSPRTHISLGDLLYFPTLRQHVPRKAMRAS